MIVQSVAERRPTYCRCGVCNHKWIVAYVPMPASAFALALKRATCPSCAEIKKIYLYEPGRTPAEVDALNTAPPASE